MRACADGSLRRLPDPGLLVLAADQVTGALGENAAPDAIEARRMQALSLAVHIRSCASASRSRLEGRLAQSYEPLDEQFRPEGEERP